MRRKDIKRTAFRNTKKTKWKLDENAICQRRMWERVKRLNNKYSLKDRLLDLDYSFY